MIGAELRCNTLNVQALLRKIKLSINCWSRDPKNNIDIRIKQVESSITNLENFSRQNVQIIELRNELDELYEQKVSMLK